MLELTIGDKRKFIAIQAVIPALRAVGWDEQELSGTLNHRLSLRPCLKTESRGWSMVAVLLRLPVEAEALEVRKGHERGKCSAVQLGMEAHFCNPSTTRSRQEGLLQSQGQPGLQRESANYNE